MRSLDGGRVVVPTLEGTRVLLLGWSPEQAPRGIAQLGVEVTCVATPTEAEAARASGVLSELVVVDDPASVESVILGLSRARLAPSDFEFVSSAHEFTVISAAIIGALGAARSLPVPVAVALRDKFVQKQLVRAAEVATADCEAVESPAQVPAAAKRLGGYPAVVKPVAGAGARDTARLVSAEHAAHWVASAGPGPWLVEQFVTGAEIHLDGVARGGQILFLSAGRYLHNIIEVHIKDALIASALVDPATDVALYEHSAELVYRVLAALGYTDGIFHVEAFEQEDGSLVFGECGGRVAGGRIDEAVRLQFGVDLHQQWGLAALGLPADPIATTPTGGTFGWVHLLAPAGLVRSNPGLDAILARPGVVQAELRIQPGDLVPEHRPDSRARAARAVLTGNDAEEVRQQIVTLAEWFRSSVEVESPAAATVPGQPSEAENTCPRIVVGLRALSAVPRCQPRKENEGMLAELKKELSEAAGIPAVSLPDDVPLGQIGITSFQVVSAYMALERTLDMTFKCSEIPNAFTSTIAELAWSIAAIAVSNGTAADI